MSSFAEHHADEPAYEPKPEDVQLVNRAWKEATCHHYQGAVCVSCSSGAILRALVKRYNVPALLAEVERLRGQLAAAEELLLGAIENGPWVLIEDPHLRQLVGEYTADTCHSVAAAAGLDEAMEYAHSRMPARLARSLPAKAAEPDAHGGAR